MALSDFFEQLKVMEKRQVQDPVYGDVTVQWVEGYAFNGTVNVQGSAAYVVGGKVGNTASVQLMTQDTNAPIIFGTKVKRVKDGTILKIVSLADDFLAPQMADATKNARLFLCERSTLD
jgi:hypothetical protein